MLSRRIRNLREYLTPVSHTSSFTKTGQITPEEFVAAGDYLVDKFPTWSWEGASSSKNRDFLPHDKQVLLTRHVPCRQRATGVDNALMKEGEGEDGWIISAEDSSNNEGSAQQAIDVPDVELEGLGIEEEGAIPENSVVDTDERTYNVYITYSTSYRVPKIYLSGYDADGAPLPPKSMFDDIVGDYKDKTVTIESSPFQDNLTLISIHPCRHASVMRLLLDRAEQRAIDEAAESNNEWEEVPTAPRVDQYLVVFLKFIASVTPTIEHDFTMTAL